MKKKKEVTEKTEKFILTLKRKFKNPEIFEQAVQLAKDGQKAGYERLEFLGDRVVGLIVAEMLYKAFPNEQEGDLAKRFVQLVCAKTLAKIAMLWGIDDLIKGENKQLHHNKNVLSDVCEAVLGGLYLDCGIEAVQEVMKPTWEPLMLSYEHAPQDYKSKLQEWSQKNFQVLPVYQLLERTGPAHMPEFTVSAEAGPYHKLAKGSSIKQAEQNAAIEILKEINAE
ncbi:MAG: ribonuclease III [Alphaproteobacteria bacterium]|nr:ribonuclease III [Alphaproteobacteria bacterium]